MSSFILQWRGKTLIWWAPSYCSGEARHGFDELLHSAVERQDMDLMSSFILQWRGKTWIWWAPSYCSGEARHGFDELYHTAVERQDMDLMSSFILEWKGKTWICSIAHGSLGLFSNERLIDRSFGRSFQKSDWAITLSVALFKRVIVRKWVKKCEWANRCC